MVVSGRLVRWRHRREIARTFLRTQFTGFWAETKGRQGRKTQGSAVCVEGQRVAGDQPEDRPAGVPCEAL